MKDIVFDKRFNNILACFFLHQIKFIETLTCKGRFYDSSIPFFVSKTVFRLIELICNNLNFKVKHHFVFCFNISLSLIK